MYVTFGAKWIPNEDLLLDLISAKYFVLGFNRVTEFFLFSLMGLDFCVRKIQS